MRVCVNTQLRTCECIAQLGDIFSWENLPTHCQNAKGFFSSNAPFSLRGVRMASESTEECVQKLGLDPSEPALVHPFVQTVQLAPWDEGCAETLCIFCSVVMCTCWPLQLIVKSRQQVFLKYLGTSCGSKVVQPRSFSPACGTEILCEDAWSSIRQNKHKMFT